MITIVDRYVGRYVLAAALLALGVFGGLFVFAVLVEALPDYGKGGFGLYELLRYVALSQPRRLYELFPVAALVGTLLGLSLLARNSELVALRAAGMATTRLAAAAFKAGLVLVVAAVLLGEIVVPVAETEAQLGRAKALSTGLRASGVRTAGAGLWLRDGEMFLNVGDLLPDRRMLDMSLYQFEEVPCGEAKCAERRLGAYVFAKSAQLEGEHWRLQDARVTRFQDGTVRQESARELNWPTRLAPEVVDAFSVRPEGLSLFNLYRYIRHLENNEQDARRYRLAAWQKLLLPFAVAVMVLLATPFVLRPLRSGALGNQVFLGIMLGLVFIFTVRSFGYFGLLYGLPPFVGASVPILLFLALAIVMLRRAG